MFRKLFSSIKTAHQYVCRAAAVLTGTAALLGAVIRVAEDLLRHAAASWGKNASGINLSSFVKV